MHVVPKNDLKQHQETSYFGAEGEPDNTYPNCECPCKPKRKYIERTGSWLFVHNAFDGREGVEWANDILNNGL